MLEKQVQGFLDEEHEAIFYGTQEDRNRYEIKKKKLQKELESTFVKAMKATQTGWEYWTVEVLFHRLYPRKTMKFNKACSRKTYEFAGYSKDKIEETIRQHERIEKEFQLGHEYFQMSSGNNSQDRAFSSI